MRLAKHRADASTAPRAASAASAIAREARAAGLEPPALRDVAAQLGLAEAEQRAICSRTSSARAARARAPASCGSTRARSTRCASACSRTSRAHGELDTPAYKALIGTSRRTAVPLMELFDAERLTVRRGETRVLRRGRS